MSRYLVDQIGTTDDIRVLTDTTVAELRGADRLEEVVLANSDSGQTRDRGQRSGHPAGCLQPHLRRLFTTKPPGQGTGLGLQISYRIIALEHRRELTVDAEPGRTTFRVVLPANPHNP